MYLVAEPDSRPVTELARCLPHAISVWAWTRTESTLTTARLLLTSVNYFHVFAEDGMLALWQVQSHIMKALGLIPWWSGLVKFCLDFSCHICFCNFLPQSKVTQLS